MPLLLRLRRLLNIVPFVSRRLMEPLSYSCVYTNRRQQSSLTGRNQLFNIYIDDLLQSLPEESCVAYADDVTLVATGKSFDDARKKLQTQIANASAWVANNCLKLNHSKYNVMFISANVRKSNASLSPILLYGRPLSVAEQITVLGVTIDSNLDWSAQCAKVRGKINGRLSVLRRFSTSLNTCRRRQVFNAIVKPHLTHCLPV